MFDARLEKRRRACNCFSPSLKPAIKRQARFSSGAYSVHKARAQRERERESKKKASVSGVKAEDLCTPRPQGRIRTPSARALALRPRVEEFKARKRRVTSREATHEATVEDRVKDVESSALHLSAGRQRGRGA